MSQPNAILGPTLLAVLFCVATVTTGNLRAEIVEIPLTIDRSHLHRELSTRLKLDTAGRGNISADACNRMELAELAVETTPQALTLELDLTAHTGLDVFGHCSGPSPFSGRISVTLTPRVATDGRALLFQAVASELQGPDGTDGLLARASRTLMERVLLPELDALRVDLGQSMDAMDQLIEGISRASSGGAPVLREPTQLASVELAADGLRATLRFSVRPLPEEHADGGDDTAAPLDAQEVLRWRSIEDEFDGFLTTIVTRWAAQLDDRDLQLELLAVLLDTRHRISEALTDSDSGPDPVRELFLSTWTALRPLLERLEHHDISDDVDLRLAGFIAAGDLLIAVDALGPQLGLEISRDGLRRLARMLMDDEAPASFTPLPLLPEIKLRSLFGLPPEHKPDSASRRVPDSSGLWNWFIPSAQASTLPPAEALRGLVPAATAMEGYLDLVAQLLELQLNIHYEGSSRVPREYREMFDPLLRATAWKESCWRHYVGTPASPVVIRSPGGAIGMMQINARVWRGVYDLERLENEVAYNVQAGMEILEHYLVDYALRRDEHLHPGGRDNLVRASYAAYNGGPAHLGRYRNPDTAPRLRAVDQAFWHDYQQMKVDRWPTVQRCFTSL